MNKEFIKALDDIEREKGVKKSVILQALEKALVKSYEENFESNSNVEIKINEVNGDIKIYSLKKVVDEVENKFTEISLEEAKQSLKSAKIDDEIKIPVKAKNFGRVAAQKARSIVIQQIKDAERQAIYDEFQGREREIINGTVQRIDRGLIFINLGKAEGVVPPTEQIPGERIKAGDRVKLYISEVKNTTKGPQITLSRSNPALVKRLFEEEIPEISNGLVEIYSISREAGSRTKIAVFSNDPEVDSVGACVGFKGVRVNTIVEELNGEKMDIIIYDKDIKKFISNSLSPSDVIDVLVNEKEKKALVLVPDEQLSLAIGKEGQNVRLAARLTSWKIDIKGENASEEAVEEFNKDLEEQLQKQKDNKDNSEKDRSDADFEDKAPASTGESANEDSDSEKIQDENEIREDVITEENIEDSDIKTDIEADSQIDVNQDEKINDESLLTEEEIAQAFREMLNN